MFIFRWLKKLLILALLVLAAIFLMEHTTTGQRVKDYFAGFLKSDTFNEGVKDLKVLTGETLKGIGDKIQEGVTPEEQKQLDNIFKDKLMKGKAPSEGVAKQQIDTKPAAPTKTAAPAVKPSASTPASSAATAGTVIKKGETGTVPSGDLAADVKAAVEQASSAAKQTQNDPANASKTIMAKPIQVKK